MKTAWPRRALRTTRFSNRRRRPERTRFSIGRLGLLAAAGIAVQEVAARMYYQRTAPPEERFVRDERTAWTPAWRELRVVSEWALAALRPARVEGMPRGDGSPVVLIPGFLMSGAYLGPMQRWLQAVGYDVRVANIGVNADCFEAITNQILHDAEAARRRAGRRVHLIGHSLGGALARAAAVREPDRVASLSLLGAPVRGLRLHPGLRAAAAIVRRDIHRRRDVPAACATFACSCESVRALAAEAPANIPLLTIATEDDGVADWRYSIDPLATRALAVRGSHLGLVANPAVYDAVAHHLATAQARAAA